MPRTRTPYSAEFRQQIIELARAGRTPKELAQEFEPCADTIRDWVAQADRDDGRRGYSQKLVMAVFRRRFGWRRFSFVRSLLRL